MVGQRATIQVDADLDFADHPATARSKPRSPRPARLDAPLGSDYFVFPKDVLGPLPPFAVGRPGWDNWMIYRARELRVPVVDASEAVLVIHQDHSYAHVPSPAGDRWEGPEAEKNRSIVNPTALRFTTRYATWRLTRSGLTRRRWWSRRDRFDAFEAAKMLHPRARPFLSAASVLMRRWDRRFVAWLAGLARADGRTGG